MSVRRRVLHAAPLIVFALTIVFGVGSLAATTRPIPGRCRADQSAADHLRARRGTVYVLFTTLGLVVGLLNRPHGRQYPCSYSPPGSRQTGPASILPVLIAPPDSSISRTSSCPARQSAAEATWGALAAIFLEVHFGAGEF